MLFIILFRLINQLGCGSEVGLPMRSFFQPILLLALVLAPFMSIILHLLLAAVGVIWMVVFWNKAGRQIIDEQQQRLSGVQADVTTVKIDCKNSIVDPLQSCSVQDSTHLPENGQLSRWDEAGVWLGSLSVLISGAVLSHSFHDTPALYFWTSSMLSGFAVVVVSGWFKRKESQIMTVWRIVRVHPELEAKQLVRDSNLSRSSLKRAISYLNSSGHIFLQWDLIKDRIYDSRLKMKVNVSQNCAGCGSSFASRIYVGADQIPSCPHCHRPLQTDSMQLARELIVAKIREKIRWPMSRQRLKARHYRLPLQCFALCSRYCVGRKYSSTLPDTFQS